MPLALTYTPPPRLLGEPPVALPFRIVNPSTTALALFNQTQRLRALPSMIVAAAPFTLLSVKPLVMFSMAPLPVAPVEV